jgi:hypothetical protein
VVFEKFVINLNVSNIKTEMNKTQKKYFVAVSLLYVARGRIITNRNLHQL